MAKSASESLAAVPGSALARGLSEIQHAGPPKGGLAYGRRVEGVGARGPRCRRRNTLIGILMGRPSNCAGVRRVPSNVGRPTSPPMPNRATQRAGLPNRVDPAPDPAPSPTTTSPPPTDIAAAAHLGTFSSIFHELRGDTSSSLPNWAFQHLCKATRGSPWRSKRGPYRRRRRRRGDLPLGGMVYWGPTARIPASKPTQRGI